MIGNSEDDAFRDERAALGLSGSARILQATDKIADKVAKPNAGHRDRLRARFAEGGRAAVADYELLEMLLFRSIPQRDTKPIAKRLLARFGTVAATLAADRAQLEDVKGVGPSVAGDLKLVYAASIEVAKGNVNQAQVLSSWSALLNYCRAAMAYEDREQFRVIFLDKKNALIADEVQQTGTVDHTPAYPREVLRRCIQLNATAIILVHNHPSGDPEPSRADIAMTAKIVEALEPVNILVHDHLIIGKHGHASLKALSLM